MVPPRTPSLIARAFLAVCRTRAKPGRGETSECLDVLPVIAADVRSVTYHREGLT
jgi:hypothetical protein